MIKFILKKYTMQNLEAFCSQRTYCTLDCRRWIMCRRGKTARKSITTIKSVSLYPSILLLPMCGIVQTASDIEVTLLLSLRKAYVEAHL
jgi:hypothetical protein